MIFLMFVIMMNSDSAHAQAKTIEQSRAHSSLQGEPQSPQRSHTKTPTSSPATPQCTVGGHGPYDLNRAECIKLAQDQSETDCNLDKPPAVSFTWKKSKTSRAAEKGECTAIRDSQQACKSGPCGRK